jgi:hypothetical protein
MTTIAGNRKIISLEKILSGYKDFKTNVVVTSDMVIQKVK